MRALRLTSLAVPAVLDRPMDGPSFLAQVERVLGPTIRPGDWVILDNLSCHHQAGVAVAVAPVGARVRYLPPYCTDFNPIELPFATLKAILPAARCRMTEALWALLGA